MNTYYLNNSGSRWVTMNREGNHDRISLLTKTGKVITRAVKYWEAFGNFAIARISYKGKMIDVFTDTVLED